MNQYLGIYDEEFIQLHVAKINADTEEEPKEKFKRYLNNKLSSMYYDGFCFISLLTEIDDIWHIEC